MKRIYTYLIITMIVFSNIFAQETKVDRQTSSIKNINKTTAVSDTVTIKDNANNVLMTVTDEGSAGSIKLNDAGAVSPNTNKLYNNGGNLYWAGSQLGLASSNGWTISGNNIYNANTGSVGIGTSPVGGKLHVKSSNFIIKMESSTQDGWLAIYNDLGSGPQYIGYLGTYNGTNDIDIGTGDLNTTGNLNLVTQATPRFIIGNDGRAGLGALQGVASLNVRGISGDQFAFRVEDPSGSPKFQVSNDGHVGINQYYTNSTFNVRGISGDVTNFTVQDPSGNSKFIVTNSGHVGINNYYPNVSTNIRGVSGDYTYFTVEDPTGNSLLDIFSSGTAKFYNDLTVSGNLSAGTVSASVKAFKIDHPLDPANKFLLHTSVESSDMMNVYNGNVILDGNGEATVKMADWFEALNKDFRYQLTPIGAPGPNLYIAEEISGNQFKIAGGSAGLKVSWQVTGIRHDAYANKNRIKVEEMKSPAERGKYLNPTAFGEPKEMGINYSQKLKKKKNNLQN